MSDLMSLTAAGMAAARWMKAFTGPAGRALKDSGWVTSSGTNGTPKLRKNSSCLRVRPAATTFSPALTKWSIRQRPTNPVAPVTMIILLVSESHLLILHDLSNNIKGPGLCLVKDITDVQPENSELRQDDPTDEIDGHNETGPARDADALCEITNYNK